MKALLIATILSIVLLGCNKTDDAEKNEEAVDCNEVISRSQIDSSNIEEAIGFADNVFVAQVITTEVDASQEESDNLMFDGKHPIKVNVVNNIKGELPLGESIVHKVVFFDGEQINRDVEDFMPSSGKYYIFVAENIDDNIVANGNYTNNPKDGFETEEEALNSSLYDDYMTGFENERCITKISN